MIGFLIGSGRKCTDTIRIHCSTARPNTASFASSAEVIETLAITRQFEMVEAPE
jgi:hypothetical protein